MDNIETKWDITTPPIIKEFANAATLELLPIKSREVYENSYARFRNWQTENSVESFSENVLLSYFSEIATKVKQPTVWSHYSMLKLALMIKNNIQIEKYSKLVPFLKRNATGYIPKKSKTLTKEQISKFIAEAPDNEYLMIKAILIFGIAGALRRDELVQLTLNDIEDLGSVLIVKLPKTKTNKPKVFSIIGTSNIDIYRKYFGLRPLNFSEKRFFIKYVNGKCQKQVVGVHKITSASQIVASFLKLPNKHLYTGHSFRRTSATLLVDAGADLTALKRHESWKSSNGAEGYVDDCLQIKKDASEKILSNAVLTKKITDAQLINSSFSTTEYNATTFEAIIKTEQPSSSDPITFNNCNFTNCTFTINIKNC